MNVSVIGNRGSGKTTFLVNRAFHSKRDVYANFWIDCPRFHKLEIIDLVDLKDNVDVFIDEGYAWLESRTSAKALNRYLSYIILQSRKRNIDIYMSAQLFSSIDIRYRYQCDVIVFCERIPDGFKYSFLDVYKNKVFTFYFPEEQAKKYYNRFNTYEIIEPSARDELELKLLEENNPKELGKRMERLAKSIMKDVKRPITHPHVRKTLLDKGINLRYESYIYVHLKDLVK